MTQRKGERRPEFPKCRFYTIQPCVIAISLVEKHYAQSLLRRRQRYVCACNCYAPVSAGPCCYRCCCACASSARVQCSGRAHLGWYVCKCLKEIPSATHTSCDRAAGRHTSKRQHCRQCVLITLLRHCAAFSVPSVTCAALPPAAVRCGS